MPPSPDSSPKTVGLERELTCVHLPVWLVRQLDAEAYKLAVSTEDIIKIWLAERLRVAHRDRPATVPVSLRNDL